MRIGIGIGNEKFGDLGSWIGVVWAKYLFSCFLGGGGGFKMNVLLYCQLVFREFGIR